MKAKFLRELKKIEETSASGAGLDEMYVSEYIHFEQLKFLRGSTAVDKTTSFMDLESDDFFFNNKENYGYNGTTSTPTSPASSNDSIIIQSTNKKVSTPLAPAAVVGSTPLQSLPITDSPMPSTSQGIKRALSYTPIPPKRPVKKPEPKTNADSLINAAMATLANIERNEVKPVDECQVTGSFVSFTLSTLDKDARVGAIAHFIEYCLSLKKK